MDWFFYVVWWKILISKYDQIFHKYICILLWFGKTGMVKTVLKYM